MSVLFKNPARIVTMQKLKIVTLFSLCLSACSSTSPKREREPAGHLELSNDEALRTCVALIDPDNHAKLNVDERYLEVPNLSDKSSPKSLYLIGSKEAFFVPQNQVYATVNLKEGLRVLELGVKQSSAFQGAVESEKKSAQAFYDAQVWTVKEAHSSSSSAGKKLSLQAHHNLAPVAAVVANEALAAYIQKMLPGLTLRYMPEQQLQLLTQKTLSEEQFQSLRATLPNGLKKGFESCVQALPHLQAVVDKERQVLAQYEVSEERGSRQTASIEETQPVVHEKN